MRPSILLASFIFILLGVPMSAASETPQPEPATSEKFTVGDAWKYQTRKGEENSRVIVGKIELAPRIGVIVHVQIVGVQIKSEAAENGVTDRVFHAPITESALAASVTELSTGKLDETAFRSSYEIWLEQHQSHNAGAFTMSISQTLDFIEQALNQTD